MQQKASSTQTSFDSEPPFHEEIREDDVATEVPIPSHADVAPVNGGYGWVCTACLLLINAHTWGVNSAWSVFLAYFLSHSTFPNASNLEFAIIGGLSITFCLLVGPLVTASHTKFGTRPVLLFGTVLVSAGMFGSSFATQIWHLFLSQGVCFGSGMGFLYIPAASVLPAWFSSHRSLAMGISSSGTGLGGLVYSLACAHAIETLGVQWSYRILGFCTLGANAISSLLMKDPKTKRSQSSHRSFNIKELGRIEVFLLALWGYVAELGYVVLLYSLPNYAEYIGLSPQQGSVAAAMLNLGLAIGRPPVGYISDRFGRINTAMVMTGLCGLLCLALWIPAKSYALLLVFALSSGMVCGTFWSTITPVTAEVVELDKMASTFGMICWSISVPAAFAEAIALQLVDTSGYLSAQIFVAAMYLVGAASLWVLRSWKFWEIEKTSFSSQETHRRRPQSPSNELKMTAYSQWINPKKFFLGGRV